MDGPGKEQATVGALRRGHEEAVARLVALHHASLRRLARLYVSNAALADGVVQGTGPGGDEEAFARLVALHHASLRRVARLYVASAAIADEVVQDTWLGVIQGIWAFEGRSSLKTWIFRILVNRARTRAVREGRSAPFTDPLSTLDGAGAEPFDPGAPGKAPGRHRRAALQPPRRAVAPRRGGMVLRGGVQRSGDSGDQSAGASAPRPVEGAGGARAVLRGSPRERETRM